MLKVMYCSKCDDSIEKEKEPYYCLNCGSFWIVVDKNDTSNSLTTIKKNANS